MQLMEALNPALSAVVLNTLPIQTLSKPVAFINSFLSKINIPLAIQIAIFLLVIALLFKLNEIHTRLSWEKNLNQNIINTSHTLIIILDQEHNIISFNQYAERITGYSQDEIQGENFYQTLIPRAEKKEIKELLASAENQKYRHKETTIIDTDDQEHIISWRFSLFENKGRSRLLVIGVDITKQREIEENLKYHASHDPLTKLPNRNSFHQKFSLAANFAERNNTGFAVFFLDVDRFKLINDIYGHQTGDNILIEISHRLRDVLPEKVTLARMSADNFIGLIPGLNNPKVDISKHLDQLLKVFEEPFIINKEEHFLTVSIGLSFYPLDGKNKEILLKSADTAMHRAKEHKGNTFQIYDMNMNANISKKLSIKNDLRKAIKNKRFTIYYQPIVDLKTGEILKGEALVRWDHPYKGIISPADFIPLAEETGLIVPLGKQILKMACAQVKEWKEKGHPIKISVNLSAQQFHNSNLQQTITETIEDSQIDPALLGLEITESIAMQDIALTSVILEEFREMNLQILLDDFGTGYSSLSYLTKFGIDVIKIDQAFVRDLPNNSKKDAIISAILTMADKLNIKTIAEGIENHQELKLLKDYNCDQAQGYLFSAPLPAGEFEKLLKGNQNLI